MHFSSRIPANLSPNRLSTALAARRQAQLPLIDLTSSNPTQSEIVYPETEILRALPAPATIRYVPEPRGLESARQAVADYYRRRGFTVSAADLLLAGSTSELYGWLFKLLCDPGDQVLVPTPSYPLFECLASLEGVSLVPYELPEDFGWPLDLHSAETQRTPRTRAIVIVNPNNPTGVFLKREEWQNLLAWAARHDLAIISDEVFFDYAWRPLPEAVSTLLPQDEALVFTLSGLSKAAGLPQMKLGWAHVSGPGAVVRETWDRLEWIADSYLPVSAPVQYAAPEWLRLADGVQKQILLRCRSSVDTITDTLDPAAGCRPIPAEGGWCCILEMPKLLTEEEWVLGLLDCGVLVQPGFFYDFSREAKLVISLLTPPRELRQGMNILQGYISRVLRGG